MAYYTPKEEYILNIINKAIEKLNKSKKIKLKLANIEFGLGVDTKNKPDDLSTIITIAIYNTKTKTLINFLYYESFFDISIADKNDVEAGINKVKEEQDKLVLRMAYNIWRHRISLRIE